jgi:hypothetical protein
VLGSGRQIGYNATTGRSEQRKPHEKPFFDSLNNSLQATGNSLRCALLLKDKGTREGLQYLLKNKYIVEYNAG